MKVNYTLPGLLPESATGLDNQTEQRPVEPFGAQLQRLRVPEITDWKAVLKLNAPSLGVASLGPPPVPYGMDSRDGASQRAWWRGTLHKHASGYGSTAQDAASVTATSNDAPVQRMLGLLQESQRREDQIFARHFAEGED